MTAWTTGELATIEAADELQIASRRRDGTLTSPRTIWVVRHGDDMYVRSVRGSASAWFRATRVRQKGHIQAGGVSKDVAFADAGHELDDDIDAAYRSKYGRYPAGIINSVITPQARATTIKLVPC
jgi:hypothetical protein